MADDSGRREAPTRREYVKHGGAVVGGGLLAGCTGGSDDGSTPEDNENGTAANDAVYRGGPIYQGPIQNLFLTERFATLLFPEAYSEGELFDRQRVADIVDGET